MNTYQGPEIDDRAEHIRDIAKRIEPAFPGGADELRGIASSIDAPTAEMSGSGPRLRPAVDVGGGRHRHGDWVIAHGDCPHEECPHHRVPETPGGGGLTEAEWDDIIRAGYRVSSITDQHRAAINRIVAAREAQARAEVVARVEAYVELVARIHEVYRHLVMDTPEDRAIHARHVETADKALRLARAALAGPNPREDT